MWHLSCVIRGAVRMESLFLSLCDFNKKAHIFATTQRVTTFGAPSLLKGVFYMVPSMHGSYHGVPRLVQAFFAIKLPRVPTETDFFNIQKHASSRFIYLLIYFV